jgi:hypothetical protein
MRLRIPRRLAPDWRTPAGQAVGQIAETVNRGAADRHQDALVTVALPPLPAAAALFLPR